MSEAGPAYSRRATEFIYSQDSLRNLYGRASTFLLFYYSLHREANQQIYSYTSQPFWWLQWPSSDRSIGKANRPIIITENDNTHKEEHIHMYEFTFIGISNGWCAYHHVFISCSVPISVWNIFKNDRRQWRSSERRAGKDPSSNKFVCMRWYLLEDLIISRLE